MELKHDMWREIIDKNDTVNPRKGRNVAEQVSLHSRQANNILAQNKQTFNHKCRSAVVRHPRNSYFMVNTIQ